MKDADVHHGGAGRPADRASKMMAIGMNWCPTIADEEEDRAEADGYAPDGPDMMEPTG